MMRRLLLQILCGVVVGQAAVAAAEVRAGSGTHDAPVLPHYEPAPPLQGRLHSVGSDSMDVIVFGWIQEFRRHHPQVHATIEARSSLSAAPALTNGLADIAPIGREFLPSELAMFRQKFGYDPLLIRVGNGSYDVDNRTHALAIYVHRDNPLRQLTLAQLDAIYSKTRQRGHAEVTKWGDLGLGGEWAERPVHLYSMRRPNGIVNFFQQRVLQGGEFKPTVRERMNFNDQVALRAVVESVAADPNGIGFAGFAHATEGVRALALAEHEGGDYVVGTPATVASHTYPLARWIYIAVNKPPGEALPAPVREFLRLVLSEQGQKVISAEGIYVPLSPAAVQEELAKLEPTPTP